MRKPSYPREEFDPADWKPTKRRKRKPVAPGGLHDAVSAAAKLNVTEEKLRAFIATGKLKFINVGDGEKRPRYRFADADLQDFIDSRKTTQDAPTCPSSKPRSQRRITGTVSSSTVVGFMAARAARLASKLKK